MPAESQSLFDCAFRTLTCPHQHNIFVGRPSLLGERRHHSADTGGGPIADAPVIISVLSAFAQERRPTYKRRIEYLDGQEITIAPVLESHRQHVKSPENLY